MKKQNIMAIFTALFLFSCGAPSQSGDKAKDSKEDKKKDEKTEAETKKTSAKKIAPKVGMQALVDAYFKMTGQKPKIIKQDVGNGYLEFETGPSLPNSRMAYYLTEDDQEILAVTFPNCMQACWSSLFFYIMMDNTLTEVQDMVEGFPDMNAFTESYNEYYKAKMTQEEKARESKGEMALYDVEILLPQKGTSIVFNKIATRDNPQQKKQAIAELQFNTKTGKFKFVKL